jgi:hypothetical protein
MQRLEGLWKLVNTAAAVRDVAQESRAYRWQVARGMTFYLHTQAAQVSVARVAGDELQVDMTLQGGFGWRVAHDQDDVGVYLVAQRRALIGGLAGARFVVRAPLGLRLALRLERCQLCLDDFSATALIPPDGLWPAG